ncbi:Hypothetical protein FKW44_007437, partial [Caligus rogercresseyi]
QMEDPNTYWEMMEDRIIPQDNFRVHRLEFTYMRQKTDESAEDFISRYVKSLSDVNSMTPMIVS